MNLLEALTRPFPESGRNEWGNILAHAQDLSGYVVLAKEARMSGQTAIVIQDKRFPKGQRVPVQMIQTAKTRFYDRHALTVTQVARMSEEQLKSAIAEHRAACAQKVCQTKHSVSSLAAARKAQFPPRDLSRKGGQGAAPV